MQYWTDPSLEWPADQLAELLRDRIVDGRYAPGTELAIAVLAEELTENEPTVREALRVLQREGLLVGGTRGAAVRSGVGSVRFAACEFREVVDGLAARLAAARGGRDLRTQLESCVHELRRAIRSGDYHASSWADVAFHFTIIDAAANQLLLGPREIVRSTLRGTRLLSEESADAVAAEHDRIIAAIAGGDPDDAEHAARSHARSDLARLAAL